MRFYVYIAVAARLPKSGERSKAISVDGRHSYSSYSTECVRASRPRGQWACTCSNCDTLGRGLYTVCGALGHNMARLCTRFCLSLTAVARLIIFPLTIDG